MKIFLLFVSSSLYLPMACLANPPIPKAITYDQIEKREHEVTLSTDVDVHASTRISTLSESFFCENQTMKVEVSQRFEERKRISVNMSVEKNGEKLNRDELSKSTHNIQDYKFYDMTFSCFNGVYGVSVKGYKLGLNGALPSAEVFNYHVDLKTGEVIPPN